MKHFWTGFEATKSAAPVRFKKHVVVLYWSSSDSRGEDAKKAFNKLAIRHPSVAVKIVDTQKDKTIPVKHKVLELPTVVLLKDGREIDRLSMGKESSLLEHLFRKASM